MDCDGIRDDLHLRKTCNTAADRKMTVEQQLKSDHEELDRLLDNTFESLAKGDCTDAYQKLDLFWARLAMHIRAEHSCLFPRIQRLSQSLDTPADHNRSEQLAVLLADLRHDHDFFMSELGRAVTALRLTFNFGNETETVVIVHTILEQVAERLRTHNLIEEKRVYTLLTDSTLPEEEIQALERSIQKELDNYPQRFTRSETN